MADGEALCATNESAPTPRAGLKKLARGAAATFGLRIYGAAL